MADMRTLREKLEAMAAHGTEPEREIAKTKLAGLPPQPPRPPAPSAAPAPEPQPWSFTTSSANFWQSGVGTYMRMNLDEDWDGP